MERPTLSNSWSRVARLTPTLRPHVVIKRQLFRGEPWFVVADPVSNMYFRLNPVDYHFFGLLDGERTVDDAWRLTLDRFADESPTQDEIIGLLGQFNQSNLIRVDLPPEAAQLLERQRNRRFKQWGGQAMNILFMRIPLVNPDRLLTWCLPLARPLLTRVGLAAWFLLMLYAAYRFVPHVGDFLRDTHSVLAPANWGWMIVLFIVTKAIHEFGHGIVCKRFGGVVPEIGLMLLVLFPAPFIDATSSWNFESKWHRLLVAAAGMLFELAVAAGAALLWLWCRDNRPESLMQQMAYNTVFLASITTILFNANPLIRFDGYYMLSDWLDVPNLYERATNELKWLVQRFGFGLKNVQPPTTMPAEHTTLVLYGITSGIYRVLLLAGIVMFVSTKLLVLGVLLGAWSMIGWAAVPLGKFLHWLFTSSTLHEHRARAIAVTTMTIGVISVLVGMLPVSEHLRASGVVEAANRADVAVQADGFVTEVRVRAGDHLEKGQIILIAHNRALIAKKQQLKGELRFLRSVERQSLSESPTEYPQHRERTQQIHKQLAYVQKQLDDLILRSPMTGTLASGAIEEFQGQYVARGSVIGRIVDMGSLRVTALVDQLSDASALFRGSQDDLTVQIRTAGNARHDIDSRIEQVLESGRSELPHPALGHAGGGQIAIESSDAAGQTALTPHFEIWLELPDDNATRPIAYPGQRAFVRFTLPGKRPLLLQWGHRLQQLIRERVVF